MRRVVAALVLAVLVFAGLSLVADVEALGESLQSFRWRLFALALVLVLGNYALRFVRWQYYLRVIDVPAVPTRLSALVFVAGFVMSITPGKMGEVLKALLLHEYRGIGIARTASVVVAERLLDLVALVTLVTLGSSVFEHGRALAVAGAAAVSLIVLACTIKPLGHGLLDLLADVKQVARVVPKLRETYDALHALTRPAPFLVGGLCALGGWALECVATWLIMRGFPGTSLGWDGATFGYSASTLAGALAMLPGGMGVTEVGMSGLFRAADPGLSVAVATAATILVRLSTLWFGVALGGVALTLLKARRVG